MYHVMHTHHCLSSARQRILHLQQTANRPTVRFLVSVLHYLHLSKLITSPPISVWADDPIFSAFFVSSSGSPIPYQSNSKASTSSGSCARFDALARRSRIIEWPLHTASQPTPFHFHRRPSINACKEETSRGFCGRPSCHPYVEFCQCRHTNQKGASRSHRSWLASSARRRDFLPTTTSPAHHPRTFRRTSIYTRRRDERSHVRAFAYS